MFRYLVTFFSLLCVVSALSPGAQVQISQAGINQAVQSLLRQVLATSSTFEIPGDSDEGLSYFNCVGNIKLDPQNAQIQLQNTGDIFIQIHNVQLEVTGQVSYERRMLGIRIFKTTADIRIKTENTFLELTLGIVSENGRPRILNKGSRFGVGKLHIYVSGNLLSWIIEKTLDMFKGRFIRIANERVVEELNKKLQSFSDRFVGIETEKELRGYLRGHGLSADYGLASNPSVVNSAFIIPVVAQFWHNGNKTDAIPPSGPYPFGAPSQMACIDVDTQVMIGSAMHALQASKFEVRKSFVIPLPGKFKNNLVNKFLNNTVLKVEILNVDRNIQFNNSGVFISMSANGSADVVVKNVTTRVLDVDFAFTAHLMQNIIIDNWTLKGSADIYKTNLSAKALVFGELNKEVLNTIWDTEVQPQIKQWINELAEPGIPLPQLDFATFCNAHVGFSGPFVRFCSDIDFKFEKILDQSPAASPSGICPVQPSGTFKFESVPLPVNNNSIESKL